MKKYIGLFNLFLFHQLLSCANDNITGVVFQLADRSSVNKITPAIFDLAVRNGLEKTIRYYRECWAYDFWPN